jgi:hypothetical protein
MADAARRGEDSPGSSGGLTPTAAAAAAGAADPWARVPLLTAAAPAAEPARPPRTRPSLPPPPRPPVDLGARFGRRVWRLLLLLRAWPALALLPLAAAEAWVVSRVGQISGRFYQIFVDGRQDALAAALLSSGGLYAAAAAFFAAKAAFAEWLALAWRRRLARRTQGLYCGGAAAVQELPEAAGGSPGGKYAAALPGPLAPPFYALQVGRVAWQGRGVGVEADGGGWRIGGDSSGRTYKGTPLGAHTCPSLPPPRPAP